MLLLTNKIRNLNDAKIETTPHLINNIFFLAKLKGVKIYFIYLSIPYISKIIQVDEFSLHIFVPDFEMIQERKIEFYFEVANTFYYVKTNILKSKGDNLTLMLPNEIFIIKNRRYARVEFDDLFSRFTLSYTNFSDFEQNNAELVGTYTYLFDEIKKDHPSLSLLYNMIISEMTITGSHFELINLKNKKIDEYSIFENIILKERKTIVIEDVAKMGSYIQDYESNDISNLHSLYKQKEKELGERPALLEIEKYKKEDSKQFLVSYVMAPIEVYDKVIGYFFLNTNQFQKHWITRYHAMNIHKLAKIFSYGLSKIKTKENYLELNKKETRIVNLSLSGGLIEIFDSILFNYLHKHPSIKIIIPCLENEIEIIGHVIRFFSMGGGYYLGITFVDAPPDHFQILEDFIYKNLNYNFL